MRRTTKSWKLENILPVGLGIILPLTSLADPLNGGISAGIENFIGKLFLIFCAVSLLVLFVIRLYRRITFISISVYLLSVGLIIYCGFKINRYLYLIDLRSNNTYLNGRGPDLNDEYLVIYSSLISIVIMLVFIIICGYKDVKSFKAIANRK